MRSVMLSAARYCRAASAIASRRRVAASQRSRQVLRSARRPALGGVGPVGPAFGEPAVAIAERARRDARRSPRATRCAPRRWRRDRRRGRSRARCRPRPAASARARRRRARARRRRGSRRARRAGPLVARRIGSRATQLATLSTSRRVASVCTACQRLNGSESCAARKRRSSPDRLATSLIGAEKPRLSDSTGGSAISLEHEGFGAAWSASARRARSRARRRA